MTQCLYTPCCSSHYHELFLVPTRTYLVRHTRSQRSRGSAVRWPGRHSWRRSWSSDLSDTGREDYRGDQAAERTPATWGTRREKRGPTRRGRRRTETLLVCHHWIRGSRRKCRLLQSRWCGLSSTWMSRGKLQPGQIRIKESVRRLRDSCDLRGVSDSKRILPLCKRRLVVFETHLKSCLTYYSGRYKQAMRNPRCTFRQKCWHIWTFVDFFQKPILLPHAHNTSWYTVSKHTSTLSFSDRWWNETLPDTLPRCHSRWIHSGRKWSFQVTLKNSRRRAPSRPETRWPPRSTRVSRWPRPRTRRWEDILLWCVSSRWAVAKRILSDLLSYPLAPYWLVARITPLVQCARTINLLHPDTPSLLFIRSCSFSLSPFDVNITTSNAALLVLSSISCQIKHDERAPTGGHRWDNAFLY